MRPYFSLPAAMVRVMLGIASACGMATWALQCTEELWMREIEAEDDVPAWPVRPSGDA
jgi:hypothetical protein